MLPALFYMSGANLAVWRTGGGFSGATGSTRRCGERGKLRMEFRRSGVATEKAAWRPKKGFAAKEAVCGALGLK